MSGLIVVAGEALTDVILTSGAAIRAVPGGGPYNVARTIGRLGGRCAFLGRLSSDRLGATLRSGLIESGVGLDLVVDTDAPTTLALADMVDGATATYRFYLEGTSAVGLSASDLPMRLPADAVALHVGSLGLAVEPMASAVGELVSRAGADHLVMVDVNCRAQAVLDRDAYIRRLNGVLARASVVKASTDDLEFVWPGRATIDSAREIIGLGVRAVLVTDGPRDALVVTEANLVRLPVRAVRVVDTVGAGDAFGGAFLTWWVSRSLGREALGDVNLLSSAAAWAIRVAALTCQRTGAEPPWLAEVGVDDGNTA